jgi:Ca2+-binding RTX toxin-like protein
LGGDGNDELFGFEGNDDYIGGDGNDQMTDTSGTGTNDEYFGGRGSDYIADILGTGDLNGGGGDDTLDAQGSEQDGANDLLNGGFGTDTCFFDEGDEVISCEVQNPL